MKRFFIVCLAVAAGAAAARVFDGVSGTALAGGGPGGGENCASRNGDANADGAVDISDAVTILSHMFLGDPAQLVPLCKTQGPSGLPDTGHTRCYDGSGQVIACDSSTCPGQDGAYATGCPPEGRFTDNGDGTVTDNCTGLMWQKDTGNNGNRLTWCDALAYCEDLSFAGHDDWRLPNVRELQSIVDYGRFNPSIDPVFGAFSSVYWSSTSVAFDPSLAWFVGFSDGYVFGGDKVSLVNRYVRAVRSGP